MPTLLREVNQFSISSGAEIAQFGWWFFTTHDDALEDAVLDIEAADVAHWWDHAGDTGEARQEYSVETAFSNRWLEQLDEDTTHVIATRPLPLPENKIGASASAQLPAECAVCVSVRSGVSDRTTNGRFYLPPPASGFLTPSGDLSSAACDEIVGSLAAYLNDCQHGDNADLVFGTWSRTATAFSPATRINVGDVIDSQRRRRNKLVESRHQGIISA